MDRDDRTLTIVMMGVSGTGKTTVGRALATRLSWAYAEGDQFHPEANVAKMRQGVPLDDDDRWPWLQAIADWIGEREAAGESAVVACSALKRTYRDLLCSGNPSVWFAHLTAPPEELDRRLRDRPGHYMPASLLPSQLETLQPLQPDEPGTVIDDAGGVDVVVAHILDVMPRLPGTDAGTGAGTTESTTGSTTASTTGSTSTETATPAETPTGTGAAS
jgi:gluconokinase